RHLLLEIRRAPAGEVESIEVGGAGTVEARERRVDGHGERVLVEPGDRAPPGRHAGAPRLSDHGPVEAPARNVRRDAGDAGHRRSRDIYLLQRPRAGQRALTVTPVPRIPRACTARSRS